MSVYKNCPEYKVCRELWEGLAELNPRAYIEFKCDDCNTYRGYCDGYLQGAEDALQEERPQGEWVPVSEKLPEKTGYYLVTRKGYSIKNHVKRVGYDANAKRWSEGSIIAWQPLPEPYKGGGAE